MSHWREQWTRNRVGGEQWAGLSISGALRGTTSSSPCKRAVVRTREFSSPTADPQRSHPSPALREWVGGSAL